MELIYSWHMYVDLNWMYIIHGIHVIQHMLGCLFIRTKYRDIIFHRNYSHIVCSGTSEE